MCGFLYALVLLLSVVDCLQTSGVTRGGSGIQIGTSDRSMLGKLAGYGGRGHSGVKLGEARFPNSTRQRTYTTSTTTATFTYAPPSTDKNGYNSTLKVGMVVPHKSFEVREYTKAVTSAIHTLQKSTKGRKLRLFER